MSSQSLSQNQIETSLPSTVAGSDVLLRLFWREGFFGYYYFAYAPVSGRCFAPGGVDRT